MSLETPEFIRRFLLHVLPTGFHRIRHYGLFANGQRSENLANIRVLLHADAPAETSEDETSADDIPRPWLLCPACGETMRVIEFLDRPPRHRGGDPP